MTFSDLLLISSFTIGAIALLCAQARANYSGIITSFLDPYSENDCYFEDNVFPHTLNQCECFGTIEIIPDDIIALYEQLRADVTKELYSGAFVEPRNSCHPTNQALIWLSSGNNRDSGDLYTRYVLAASYYAMNGTNWDSSDLWLSEQSECTWFGLQCNSLHKLSSFTFDANNIHGTLPTEMGYLTTLHALSITRNHLIGTIPLAIFGLPQLEILRLYANTLIGSIPPAIASASNLRVLQIDNNLFFGKLPTELGAATMLEEFSLAFNEFFKNIPSELGQLTNLKYLNLEENRFSGTISTEIGLMTSLEVIRIGKALMHGTMPTELAQLTSLKDFGLANSGIGGTLSSELANLEKLQRFELRNNRFTGTLMSELGLMSSLTHFDLDENDFTGTIPSELGNLVNLTRIGLSGCLLSGTVPSELGVLTTLEVMKLDTNLITGSVPQEVCDLRQVNLDVLVTDCPNNDGRGVVCPIPDCCTFCSRRGQDPPTGEIPDPTEPVTFIKDYNLEDCISDLIASDLNQDQALHQNEYLGFLQMFAKRFCADVSVLSLAQMAAFNTIACFCQSQPDASLDCCVGGNAAIQLNGTLDEEQSEVLKDYFRRVCRISADVISIPEPQCQQNITVCEERMNCPNVTCEDEFSALEQCLDNQIEEPGDFQACAECSGLQSLFNISEGGGTFTSNMTESMCEIEPNCEDSCGACYGDVGNLARCVFDCDTDNEEDLSPLTNATSSNFTPETVEPNLYQNETEPPFENATVVPNATVAPRPVMNSTTIPPTLTNSSEDIIFDRQPEQAADKNKKEPPFGQNVSVVLQGLTRRLTPLEQTSYVEVTQAFVQVYDPTAKVEFVSQRLIDSSPSHRRLVQTTTSKALEVTTRMTSQEDDTPGETASDMILVHSSSYVQILQQTSEAFDVVQTVEVVDDSEEAFNNTESPDVTPAVVPPEAPTSTPQEKKDKRDNLLWYGIGIITFSVIVTIFFVFKLLKSRNNGPVVGSGGSLGVKDLDEYSGGNSKDDDRQYRYDRNQVPRYPTRSRSGSSRDYWACEPNSDDPRHGQDHSDSSAEDSDSSGELEDKEYWSSE